jgi:N-acetylmuramoyl-L-alanine amidase
LFKILTFVILFTLSSLASDANDLRRANNWLNQKDTKTILKAYHEFKNIRINAIMQDDKGLKTKALKGIIRAGKLLHMNILKYEKELYAIDGKKVPKQQLAKVAKVSKNSLKSAQWRSGTIVLRFASKVQERQINYFILDKKFKKNYRYIFDIKASSSHKISLGKKNLHAIRISSDKEKVRLVLESKNALKLKYSRRGKELIIDTNSKLNYVKPKVVTNNTSSGRPSNTKKIVVIDAGHGGRDGGAVGYKKYREKIIVFQISKRLKSELEKLGYKVYMTRTKDRYIKLRNRTAFANKKKADLFISVHANSVVKKGKYKKHHGIETYYLSRTSSKRAKNVAATENSKDIETMNYFAKESFLSLLNTQKILASNKLAIDLQRGMLGVLRKSYNYIKDGGVKKGPFWVLVGAQMPAALVEVGFVTSPKEARNLVNGAYQQKLAKGLALGVKNYFDHNQ